jgi:hypothetical protein
MRENCQSIPIRDIFLEKAGKTVHFIHQIQSHVRAARRTLP